MDRIGPSLIDSHIHLWPADEADTLSSMTPNHPLRGAHSLAEYEAAIAGKPEGPALPGPPNVRGYIVVEANRRHDLTATPPDLSGPLLELAFLRRLREEEDSRAEAIAAAPAAAATGRPRCLAVIPWAPLPLGPAAVEEYLARAREVAGEAVWSRVRGFRYLVDAGPPGAMLTAQFIDALKLLGRRGYVFELGVDSHRRGRTHLEEAVELVARARAGVPEAEWATIILNHLGKPNFWIVNLSDPSYSAWRALIYTLSCMPRVYIQLSGGFSEMPPGLPTQATMDLLVALVPWVTVVLATFGPSRIMFGSDWPVCEVSGGGVSAWQRWRSLVEKVVWMGTLKEDAVQRLFAGTAIEAFGIKEE